MSKVKVGFLPLYVKLYDDVCPQYRPHVEAFMNDAAARLEAEGVELVKAPVCRLKDEFMAATELFNKNDVDAVVTLHLAYSPSLESIDALLKIKAPLIVMDSTPTYDFTDHAQVMTNHGIHGVQDMCNLLRQNGRGYFIEAGHISESDVVARVAGLCRAAKAAKTLKSCRVGAIGEPFAGMGDFRITPERLKEYFGATIVDFDFSKIKDYVVTDAEIDAEIAKDKENFVIECEIDEDYRESTRANLIVKKWMDAEKLDAFTFNFLACTKASGMPRVPFMAACKEMAEGRGYAGEGDVMTAAFVGALLSAFPGTTFAEMFCPNWKEGTIFLSHMGEWNIAHAMEKPSVIKMDYNYTDCGDPVISYGTYKAGPAIFWNVAPQQDGYDFIIAPIEMLDQKSETMHDQVEGWFKPALPLEQFLPAYSLAGGTHHGGFVYGATMAEMEAFGKLCGMNVVKIG